MQRDHSSLDAGNRAIEFVFKTAMIDDKWSVRAGRGFSWWGHRLEQRIWADVANGDDGVEVSKVHVSTSVLRLHPRAHGVLGAIRSTLWRGAKAPEDLATKLAAVNRFAIHSALVHERSRGTLDLHACIYVHAQNLEITQRQVLWVMGLQLNSAETQAETLAAMFNGVPAVTNHPQSGPRTIPDELLGVVSQLYVPAGKRGSPYAAGDFEAAIGEVGQLGCLGFPGKDGFTFEVPVRGKGRPALMTSEAGVKAPPETALVTASNVSNPALGGGCLLLLRLPFSFPNERTAADVAGELNDAEIATWTRSHFAGAWCNDKLHVLFVRFLPAAEYERGQLVNECVTLAVKARWASELLDAGTIHSHQIPKVVDVGRDRSASVPASTPRPADGAKSSRGESAHTTYEVSATAPSPEFAACWQSAGEHLEGEARRRNVGLSWLKSNLEPPFLEHLSFNLKNQLFFIRLMDIEGKVDAPGTRKGLTAIADGCSGHPCVMWMLKTPSGWEAARPGWGLVHATTDAVIDPTTLATDEFVEMTDWELHDFAVQTVRQQLEKEGRQIMSSQGNPHVDPSIWFVGDQGPEWVVVRAVRYPKRDPAPPANWAAIAASCARASNRGNFAPVSVASASTQFDGSGSSVVPLWRGGPMYVSYRGLVPRA